MKILMITFGFVEHTVHFCESLSANHQILLFIPRSTGRGNNEKLVKDYLGSSVKIHFTTQYSKTDPRNLINIMHIKEGIASFRPDVVCIQTGHPWLWLLKNHFKTYPLVLDLHDPIPHSGGGSGKYVNYLQYLTRSFVKLSDRFIVHGKILADNLCEEFDISKKLIYIMKRGGYNVSKIYDNTTIASIRNRILFFGRIAHYKGIDVLVKSQPFVTKKVPDAVYHIVGKEQYNGYKQFIIHKDKFIFETNPVPWRKVHKIFREADIVVLPYLDATQSGVLSTALAYNKPIIITRTGSMPDMIEHGKTGLIVSPNNVKALSAAIIFLLKNKKLKSDIIQNSKNRLKGDLSWTQLTKSGEGALQDAYNHFRSK